MNTQTNYKLEANRFINAIAKLKSYLFMILKNVKTKYGPRADPVKWVYTAIVRPRILYVYYIWGHRVNKNESLQTLQR